jgi:hypothetical protein
LLYSLDAFSNMHDHSQHEAVAAGNCSTERWIAIRSMQYVTGPE